MSKKTKVRPNRFKFDAFDAGLDNIPGRDGADGSMVEMELNKPSSTPDPESAPKTAQQYVEELIRGQSA